MDKTIQKIKETYGTMFSTVFKTITSDNGSEFSEIESIDCENVDVYYTHPYTACERGTIERHNGLVRRFIPKGKSIDDIDDKLISYVENWFNTLHRKILGYKTLNDLFIQEIQGI